MASARRQTIPLISSTFEEYEAFRKREKEAKKQKAKEKAEVSPKRKEPSSGFMATQKDSRPGISYVSALYKDAQDQKDDFRSAFSVEIFGPMLTRGTQESSSDSEASIHTKPVEEASSATEESQSETSSATSDSNALSSDLEENYADISRIFMSVPIGETGDPSRAYMSSDDETF